MLKLAEWIDGKMVLRAVIALAPGLLLYALTQDTLYTKMGLLTIALLIGVERCQRSVLLLVVHALLLALSISALFVAEQWPVVFVLLCVVYVVYAFLSVWIARMGARWSAVGNFTFIPALYFAYELHASGTTVASCLHLLLLGLPLAVGSVLLASFFVAPHDWRLRWQRWPMSMAERRLLTRSALVRSSAVLLTACGVSYFHPEFGQWVIWSSASVATGELTAAHHKGKDRALGALYGLSLGALLSFFVPHNLYVYEAGMVLILLTLVAFKRYRMAFAARCCCIVLTAAAGGHGLGIGLDRLEFVLLGGAVGVAVAYGLERGMRWHTGS